MSSASPGLHSKSQRLGVIPLVLFWNLSGSSSLKSLKLEREETFQCSGLSLFVTLTSYLRVLAKVLAALLFTKLPTHTLWEAVDEAGGLGPCLAQFELL